MKTKNSVKYMIIIYFILSFSFAIAEESGDIYLGLNFVQESANSSDDFYKFQNQPQGLDYYKCCLGNVLLPDLDYYYAGLNAEYVLLKNNIWTNSLNSSFFLKNYNNSSESCFIIETQFDWPEEPRGYGFGIIETKVKQSVKLSMIFFDLDLLYKIKFNTFIQFGANVGPYISIPSFINSKETYIIKKEREYSEEYLKHDTIPDRNLSFDVNDIGVTTFWGIRSNVFLEYEFLDLFKATAEVGYSYPLTFFKEEMDWKLNSTYMSFKVSYKLK